MSRSALALIVALAFLTASDRAAAQSGADVALAKQQFMLGKTYYDQGAYQRALSLFQESYRLSKRPDLLYNIGRCYESLAMLNEAIDAYGQYLKKTRRKDSNVSARIRNLKTRRANMRKQPDKPSIKKQPDKPSIKKQPDKPSIPKQPDRVPDPISGTTPPQDDPGATPGTTPEAPADPAPKAGRHWMTWAGWGLMGVGGVSLIASIGFGAKAASKSQAVEDLYKRNTDDWAVAKPFYDDGQALESSQIATMLLGIVAIGGGVALWWLSPKTERATSPDGTEPNGPATPTAQIAPMISGNTLGLMGRLTF